MKKISILLLFASFVHGPDQQLQKSKADLKQEQKEQKAKNEKYTWEIRQHFFAQNARCPHEDDEVFSTLRILFEAIDDAVDKVTKSPTQFKHDSSGLSGGGGLPVKKTPSSQSKKHRLKQLIICIILYIYKTIHMQTNKSLPTKSEALSPLTAAFLAEMIQQLFEEDEIVSHIIPPTDIQQLYPSEDPEINN